MQVRIRETGAVMYIDEFRAYQHTNGGPSWGTTTPEILDSLGADVVLEGPQATGGTVYQYSQRDGVEQIDGKWYTKYVLGPVFTDITDEAGNVTPANEQEAACPMSVPTSGPGSRPVIARWSAKQPSAVNVIFFPPIRFHNRVS